MERKYFFGIIKFYLKYFPLQIWKGEKKNYNFFLNSRNSYLLK